MAAAAAIRANALMPRKANSNRPRTPIRRNIGSTYAELPPASEPSIPGPDRAIRAYSVQRSCRITSAGVMSALSAPRLVQTSMAYCEVW